MKYNDIEKDLSSFTFKEPNQNLKDVSLLKARTVWAKEQHVPVFPSKLIRNYAYALATLFLISIISSQIDLCLTNKLIDGKIKLVVKALEKSNDIGSLCSDLGIDCKNYKIFANIFRTKEIESKPTIFDLREQLMEELNLMNGGLS